MQHDILSKIQSVQRKVMEDGFHFDNLAEIRLRIHDELIELQLAIVENEPLQIIDELGDVLFLSILACTDQNLDASQVLEYALEKFNHRYLDMLSGKPTDGKRLPPMSIRQKRNIWQNVTRGDSDE